MNDALARCIETTVNGCYVSQMPTDLLLTHRFEMRATDSWIHRVDEWRAKQPGIPSRAEAIRRLVELGLKGQ